MYSRATRIFTRNTSTTCKRASIITDDEFRKLFERCRPPSQWPSKLAVAYSGGPDSTCLLFLLQRLLQNHNENLPRSLLSITVDHAFQSNSSEVASQCASISRSLGIPNRTLRIPWSTPPFPALPPKRDSERIARDARYHLLFHTMVEEGVDGIAFGHHADDQVETVLMRLVKGSSEVGAGGMRPYRRWGMGFGNNESSVGWAGERGMNKWIVRPFLPVPKERIIATCEHYGLDYVHDPTNFDPGHTSRNAIRKALDEGNVNSLLQGADNDGSALLSRIAQMNGRKRPQVLLRRVIQRLSARLYRNDVQVNALLQIGVIPSAPSTILLRKDVVSWLPVGPLRLAIVRRIMRCVSPYPWGSLPAEAGGRTASFQRIADRLSGSDDLTSPVVSGGAVMWKPVTVKDNGSLKYRPAKQDEVAAWLAVRQPLLSHQTLVVDVSEAVRKALAEKTQASVLYDNRFVVRIDPHSVDNVELSRILIRPREEFLIPEVVQELANGSFRAVPHESDFIRTLDIL